MMDVTREANFPAENERRVMKKRLPLPQFPALPQRLAGVGGSGVTMKRAAKWPPS
jgi:hypothetical protein